MKNSDVISFPNAGGLEPIVIIDIIDGGYVNRSTYRAPRGEVFTKPSLTVPDMQLSLRAMLDRHLHGSSVKTFQTANVPVDSMIPINLERMSKIDRAELSQGLSDFVVTTRGKLQTARQARQKAEFDSIVVSAAERMRLASLSSEGSSSAG